MVFKFGIFSGNIERSPGLNSQPLHQANKEQSNMFKFENKNIKPVADLPLSMGTQPYVKYTTDAPVPKTPEGKIPMPIGLVPSHKGYQKFLDMQKLFLKDDGTYVWLKMGLRDKVLYRVTAGLCFVAIGSFGYDIYRIMYKKF